MQLKMSTHVRDKKPKRKSKGKLKPVAMRQNKERVKACIRKLSKP